FDCTVFTRLASASLEARSPPANRLRPVERGHRAPAGWLSTRAARLEPRAASAPRRARTSGPEGGVDQLGDGRKLGRIRDPLAVDEHRGGAAHVHLVAELDVCVDGRL